MNLAAEFELCDIEKDPEEKRNEIINKAGIAKQVNLSWKHNLKRILMQ